MSTTIQVKERPILFSTPMVQGILGGIKRMTRRTKGLEEINKSPDEWIFIGMRSVEEKSMALFEPVGGCARAGISCPYGKPGDRLWVRETFGLVFCEGMNEPFVGYKADKEYEDVKWKPSIHMPRTASRILLEIEDIRVERLQDITEEDAIAEGVEKLPGVMSDSYKHYSAHMRYSKEELKEGCPFTSSARASFCSLWESLNGRESLLQNHWVWVVTFKVVEVKK